MLSGNVLRLVSSVSLFSPRNNKRGTRRSFWRPTGQAGGGAVQCSSSESGPAQGRCHRERASRSWRAGPRAALESGARRSDNLTLLRDVASSLPSILQAWAAGEQEEGERVHLVGSICEMAPACTLLMPRALRRKPRTGPRGRVLTWLHRGGEQHHLRCCRRAESHP